MRDDGTYAETDSYTWQRFVELPGLQAGATLRLRYDRVEGLRSRRVGSRRRPTWVTDVWLEDDPEPYTTPLGLASVLGAIDVCHARTVLGVR